MHLNCGAVEALDTLGFGPEGDIWREDWQDSQSSFRPNDIFFLEEKFIRESCRFLKMPDEIQRAFICALGIFERRPELKRLAWHCHFLLFGQDGYPRNKAKKWPEIPRNGDAETDMFYAFVFLSGLPRIMSFYREKSIPEEIAVDTLSDLELWMIDSREKRGALGLHNVGWLWLHFNTKLFKIGRLQFEFETFKHDFHGFRKIADGSVVVLAGDGMRFRGDGQFDGANGIYDKENAWTATFSQDTERIKGFLISPLGRAVRREFSAPSSEWERVLGKGDSKLAVHITAAGPMDFDACGKSFERAGAFFEKHFPDFKYRFYTCESWILDRQFEQVLKPTSNIVRFLQEAYLFPLPGATDEQTFERVFGGPIADPDSAPRDSSVRRAIIDHIESGNHWRKGGAIWFRDGLRWGEKTYRAEKKNENT